MEKRLFIAIFISIAFLWAWGALAPKLFPELARKPAEERVVEPVPSTDTEAPATESPLPEPSQTTAALPDQTAATPAVPSGPSVEPIVAATQEQIVFENEHFVARFTNRGAVLRSFVLKNYREQGSDQLVELVRSRPDSESLPFAIRSGSQPFNDFASRSLYAVDRTRDGDQTVLRFRAGDEQGRLVTKTFVFNRDHAFRYDINTRGLTEPYRMVIGPGVGRAGAEADDRLEMSGNLVVRTGDDYEMIKRKKIDEFMTIDNPRFIGLVDHYFATILLPERSGAATVRPTELPRTASEETDPLRELWVGVNAVEGQVTGTAFFGPKKAEILEQYGLGDTLELGVFGVIARFLLTALVWVNSYTHNFGWAIVLLTVLIKLVLYPLQHKSIVSMKRMQKVQPKMNAIRDKYRKAKTDPQQKQKMNLEMMELYKKEGINPMSGCLPILLQLPILWAFYILLSNAIELRGEPFIWWITDLSLKDPYYITPILMTITMFIQQWITPTAADPMQRKIFLMMPIIFGYIFKEFPSGLVLYWLVQNLLTILQQSLMNRWWKEHPESLERGATT